MATPLADEDLVEILVDDVQLGHDADGLPRSEPTEKKVEAKAPPKEPVKPAIDVEGYTRQIEEHKRAAEDLRQARAKDQADHQARVDAEKAARVAAEERAHKSDDISLRVHWEKIHGDKQRIESGISAEEARAAAAEQEYARAMEAGEHGKAATAQRVMARSEAVILELQKVQYGVEEQIEQAKRTFTAAAKEPPARKEEAKPAKEEQPKPQSPEDWIAGVRSSVGSKVADWLDANREFVTNGKLNDKVIKYATAWAALEEKPLNSDEFIADLNAKFLPKPKKPAEPETKDEEAEMAEEVQEEPAVEVEKPRKSAPAAPVSRAASPSKASGSGGAIRLTQEQYAIAPQLYDKYEDFDPEVKAKFPQWSETAARFQYNTHLQRAKKEKAHRFTS